MTCSLKALRWFPEEVDSGLRQKTSTMRYAVVAALSILAVAPAALTVAAPAAQLIVLTQDRIASVDMASSRLAVSRATSPGDARKVISAGPFVFLQRKQAVDVLDARTFQRLHMVEWSDEVRDVATSGSLLLVAVASDVHILRVGAGGQTATVRSIHLTKAVDALTAVGTRAYALDDLRVPLFMHRIDLSRPESPRVETMPWEDTNAHLKAQAVGDRWYVLVAYTTISERGQYVVMLPATTPLRELGQRTVARERKPLRAGVPGQYFVEDFRVFRGVFFGVAPADDHLWLVRRNLATEAAETQRVADLGPVGSPGTERRGTLELVGSRLYVGTSSGLQGYELDPVRPPTRVVNFQLPSPVVSIAIQVPGR